MRRTMELCGVTIQTAFTIRHKILNAIEKDYMSRHPDFKFEVDEKVFPVNKKGERSLEKKKRSHKKRDIGDVDDETRRLYEFINSFSSVSTKYLSQYICFYMWLKEHKNSLA